MGFLIVGHFFGGQHFENQKHKKMSTIQDTFGGGSSMDDLSSFGSSYTTGYDSSRGSTIGNVILKDIVSFIISDMNLINHGNVTHNQTKGGINWEQAPQGAMTAIAAIVSLIWLCFSLKGIFKNQISLQRKLFSMILGTCTIRTGMFWNDLWN